MKSLQERAPEAAYVIDNLEVTQKQARTQALTGTENPQRLYNLVVNENCGLPRTGCESMKDLLFTT